MPAMQEQRFLDEREPPGERELDEDDAVGPVEGLLERRVLEGGAPDQPEEGRTGPEVERRRRNRSWASSLEA